MDLGMEGKRALVTGGSRGMGRAIASELSAEGCDVAVAARGADDLAATAKLVEQNGRRAVAVSADLSTAEGVDTVFAAVDTELGGLDILVNVTGADGYTGEIEDLTDDDWHGAFEIGVMATVRCCREAAPRMRERGGGRIVNIAAMSIRRQFPSLIAYTAAKSAVASLSKSLARSLAPDGILVNTVCPGIIWTEGLLGAFPDVEGSPAEVETTIMRHIADLGGRGRGLVPDLVRPGRPEEIAAAVAFLVSSRASYITGALLNVDGGSDF